MLRKPRTTLRAINRALEEFEDDEPIFYLKLKKTNTFVKNIYSSKFDFNFFTYKKMYYVCNKTNQKFEYNRFITPPEDITWRYDGQEDMTILIDGKIYGQQLLAFEHKKNKNLIVLKIRDEEAASNIRESLVKTYILRKKLLKNDVFFLSNDDNKVFKNLSIANRNKEELEEILLKMFIGELPAFPIKQLCFERTEKFKSVFFSRNPMELLYPLLNNGEFTNSAEVEMSNIIGKADIFADKITLCKLQFDFKNNEISNVDELLTEFTVSSAKRIKI